MKGLYRLVNIEFMRWLLFLMLLCIAALVIPILIMNSAVNNYAMLHNHSRFEDLYIASGSAFLFPIFLALVCLYFLKTFYAGYWGSKSVYTYLTLPIRRESLYLSKLIVFMISLLLLILVQFVSIRLGYALFVNKAGDYIDGKFIMNNGLYLAFVRSDFFHLLLPFSFSRILSSCSMLLVITTGIYYAALCERSKKYWGVIALGAAALLLYRVLTYRLNESSHYFEPTSLYPSSLMLLLLSGFFLWHGLRMIKRGTIA
ncbi:hypothetical protein [Cohnella abietis]|uniref:hypothetical protein n=1 Tax=Cohnella abietis TaxID=2507935 RepID=UPI00102E7912|nr:hypothetical protein [Cohnella abietis]